MADPFNGNISAADAARYDRTQFPGGAKLSLATRMRQMRTDMDALVAGVTAASIKAALAGDAADIDCGGAQIINAGNVTAAGNLSANRVVSASGVGAFAVVPPAVQPLKINDPVDLATCQTAIAEIIDVLEGAGLSAS